MVVGVLILAGFVAVVLSFRPEMNRYFRDCQAYLAAARPDPGPAPLSTRVASVVWLTTIALNCLLPVVGTGSSFSPSVTSTSLALLVAALCFLPGVRNFANGSLVARPWLTALAGWSVLFGGVAGVDALVAAPAFAAVGLACAVAGALGLTLSYLPASRAYSRAAQPPPPHKAW